MTIEIDRRFLLRGLTFRAPGVGVQLRDGYLAEEDTVEVRVRITSATATLTVKAGVAEVEFSSEVDAAAERVAKSSSP